MFTLQQGNANTHTVRNIADFLDESGTLGGIGWTMLFICQVLYWFFGEPFRELSLALYYQKLRERAQTI